MKNRDKLIKYLASKKISCQIHYPYSLNNIQAFTKKKIGQNDVSKSTLWAKECVSLPLYPGLKMNDLNRIIKEIKNFFKLNK